MNDRLKSITIGPSISIHDAMQVMDKGPKGEIPSPSGIVLIVDDRQNILGIATDGDIREAILANVSLDAPIKTIMTSNPLTVHHTASATDILTEFHQVVRKRGTSPDRFHHIITVDDNGKVVDILTPFELWKHSEIKIKTVAVMGLGYVGLTLALTLNEFGIRVIGVDTNEDVINQLKNGMPHFYEKGLETLLKKHANTNLILSTDISKNASDVFIVCVGTPVDNQGNVNDDYLISAVRGVGKILKPHDLVILRSTVPIGTCRNTVVPLLEEESKLKADHDFFVAFAPERTVEGKALEELQTLPQVIGGYNKQSLDSATQLFRVFTHTIVSVESLEEAEAVKLLNNTFRDVSFAFANEVALTCSGFNLDTRNIIRAANEGYVRNHIPYPSPGVGGACLVKDPYLYAASAKAGGYTARLPIISREVNESMIDFVARKVDTFCQQHGKDPAHTKLFLMGMAFKGNPETSDIRHSTAVDILKKLESVYKDITIYDPVAHIKDLEELGSTVVTNPADGCANADCVLILNNHPSYTTLDIYALAGTMKTPSMLMDPWGMFRKEQLQSLKNVHYTGL